MRLFPLPFILLLATSTGLPQSESCDANPRWLLVTVLAEETWLRSEEKDQLERVPMFTHTEERLALLDRCEIYLFSAYRPTLRAYPGSNEAAVATIATTSTRANGKIVGLTEHWVKESLQDICRVMKDCEDTTN